MHNVLNALAAIGVSLSVEAPVKAIQQALTEFTGVGRRFSIWGEATTKEGKKYLVVDDYGHHPAEMAATIKAARGAYPGKELVFGVPATSLFPNTRLFRRSRTSALNSR